MKIFQLMIALFAILGLSSCVPPHENDPWILKEKAPAPRGCIEMRRRTPNKDDWSC